jgi:segregation and condensation protein A
MYHVELEQFEGPMDLLLFFIRRDEIDIYDIPIARIADEYLAYVRVMEEIDLDGVGDFIYMAALLINIKARMLLPSRDVEEEDEAVDPRQELVERLLEYMRFKEATDQLSTRRERRRDYYTRGDASEDRKQVEEAHEVDVDASVYDLVQALGRVLEDEDEDEPVHEVEPLEHTVEEQQRYVLRRLSADARVSFRELVQGKERGFVIATFLALLELARQQYLRLHIEPGASHFVVEEHQDKPLRPDDPAYEDVQVPQENGLHGESGPVE